ncbi:uncharacterized protein B0H18DRAFT_1014111 [Fomitopsis serialis]|uniref:uncharacterized protein n=1 Tax=Fomitopsis serialis TaxID=139415 RepID=UPI0020083521|nr:uncharacterized protein B0H18DRAFT_1014111 [Neoantrodia serialis]KAH9923592.1 hypothetical protein B0H18DRAFT_1014111 [Neoantrodia serialis]
MTGRRRTRSMELGKPDAPDQAPDHVGPVRLRLGRIGAKLDTTAVGEAGAPPKALDYAGRPRLEPILKPAPPITGLREYIDWSGPGRPRLPPIGMPDVDPTAVRQVKKLPEPRDFSGPSRPRLPPILGPSSPQPQLEPLEEPLLPFSDRPVSQPVNSEPPIPGGVHRTSSKRKNVGHTVPDGEYPVQPSLKRLKSESDGAVAPIQNSSRHSKDAMSRSVAGPPITSSEVLPQTASTSKSILETMSSSPSSPQDVRAPGITSNPSTSQSTKEQRPNGDNNVATPRPSTAVSGNVGPGMGTSAPSSQSEQLETFVADTFVSSSSRAAGGESSIPVAPSDPLSAIHQNVDPDVRRYLESLRLSPEVYASKLERIGLKNGAMIDATRDFISESRKDKLEEDLQKLAGLTVIESMVLISGLRRPNP